MRLLSLDASTQTVGLAVLDYTDFNSKQLVHCEFYKPNLKKDLYKGLSDLRKFIQQRLTEFSPNRVLLEEIILHMEGKTTAKTITSLAVLNRTVGLAVYDHRNSPPELLNVLKIRHALKLTPKLPAKEEIPALVEHHLSTMFPWVKNKKGNIVKENYDMADALAVGLAGIKLSFPQPKTIKVKKK